LRQLKKRELKDKVFGAEYIKYKGHWNASLAINEID